jgi:hypothetical protein
MMSSCLENVPFVCAEQKSPVFGAGLNFSRFHTLQDALRVCDPSMLSYIVMRDHASYSFPTQTLSGRYELRLRVGGLLESMCKRHVVAPVSQNVVLLPEISYSVDAKELSLKRWVNVSVLGLENDKGSHSLATIPWEEVLGYKVVLPFSLCMRERYMVLASAFWEMVFYELEYEWARERVRAHDKCGVQGECAQNKRARESRESCASVTRVRDERAQGECCQGECARDEGAQDGCAHNVGFYRQLHNVNDENKMNRAYLERLGKDATVLNEQSRAAFHELELQVLRQMCGACEFSGET